MLKAIQFLKLSDKHFRQELNLNRVFALSKTVFKSYDTKLLKNGCL